MGFPDAQVVAFRALVAQAKRPLILFDDDCDGTAAFVLLYHAIGDGKGLPVKKTPVPVEPFLRRVGEYKPDMVFILDKPQVEPAFLDGIGVPVVWLDHHTPINPPQQHVHYFNPHNGDEADNRPTSYWLFEFVGKPQDLWVAAFGAVGDWYVPEFLKELKRQHPDLLPRRWKTIEDLYVDTRLGELIKVVMFNLKGTVTDMMGSVKTLLKIEDPHEILDQTTARGRYLWRKYRAKAVHYLEMLDQVREASKAQEDSPFLYFEYRNDEQTFTAELSNELIIRYPGRIIIIARYHDGDVKASLRSFAGGPAIDEAVKQALEGLPGTGGGHTHACGVCIPEEHWSVFLERFKGALDTGRPRT